jgi:hypothetical protein
MGGFVIEEDGTRPRMMPKDIHRLRFTDAAIVWLAKHEPNSLPNLTESQISDKSTSNTLAKSLACIQAAWFCVNCVVRASQGLSVSLLELNTAAHAVCALVVYCLWWKKPQDVAEPTLLEGPLSQEMLAWKVSQDGFEFVRTDDAGQPVAKFSTSKLSYDRFRYQESTRLAQNQPLQPGMIRFHVGQAIHGQRLERPRLKVEAHLFSIRYTIFKYLEWQKIQTQSTEYNYIDISEADVERIRVSNEARIRFQERFQKRFQEHLRYISYRLRWTSASNMINVDKDEYLRLGLIVAGLLYGGLHLSAWNDSTLNSKVGLLFWRISCVTIASFGPIIVVAVIVQERVVKSLSFQMTLRIEDSLEIIFVIAFALFLAFVVLCRLNLTVESYYSLKNLPVSAYQQPVWSRYIPHIS